MMNSSYRNYLEDVEVLDHPPAHIRQLGALYGFEDNLKRVFSLIPGAGSAYTDLVALIESKAKEGAEQAIPRIKSEVEATVKPYVIAALLLGFGGFMFGISTYMIARRG